MSGSRAPGGSESPGGSGAVVIGLTTYLERARSGVWDVEASFLPRVYLDAVVRAGGVPVLLPPQPVDERIAARVLDGLDGLVLTGGKDVDPARYGQAPHPMTDVPRPQRDAWEDALLSTAIARDLPFLGICRGLQLLNVSRGGTLVQHLPEVVGSDRYNLGGGVFAVNEVRVEAGSALAGLLGHEGALAVKSYHHQAVDRLGEGLAVTARSDDGTVQAIELAGAAFGLAVQWHPEEDPADLRLFAGLVDAAGQHRAARLSAAGRAAGLAAPPALSGALA
ncbi:MAG: gamma-glutamyl-gamma-aminobutyrate hydrolase family protein [Microbacteriaceae bacterium]